MLGAFYTLLTGPVFGVQLIVPDPENRGEREDWFSKELKEPRTLRRNPRYNHLFYSTWDSMKGVRAWKAKTGHPKVVNAWYQTRFSIPKADFQPKNVIYIPYIKGEATIWIGDQLVRTVSKKVGAGDAATVIQLSEAGVKPDEVFRLTIKVHSPQSAGGLIGPVYLARSIR